MQQELPQRHGLLASPQNGLAEVEGWRAGAGAPWNPPTVADTKRKFYEAFRKPVPGIYNNIVQELLVQQHLMRWNKKYTYDGVPHGSLWALLGLPVGERLSDGVFVGGNLGSSIVCCGWELAGVKPLNWLVGSTRHGMRPEG